MQASNLDPNLDPEPDLLDSPDDPEDDDPDDPLTTPEGDNEDLPDVPLKPAPDGMQRSRSINTNKRL